MGLTTAEPLTGLGFPRERGEGLGFWASGRSRKAECKETGKRCTVHKGVVRLHCRDRTVYM